MLDLLLVADIDEQLLPGSEVPELSLVGGSLSIQRDEIVGVDMLHEQHVLLSVDFVGLGL